MPRYLALDYFAIAQLDARALLSRLQLPKAEHPELTETYQGLVTDTLYRIPWLEHSLLHIEEDCLEEQINSLAPPYGEEIKLDKYESSYAEAQGEIVPSSNPCSQESIDEEVLYKLDALNSEDAGQEYIEKHTEIDRQASMFMEELCEDGLHAAPPEIGKLLSRLKPIGITDPFVDEDGNPLEEEMFLGPSRKLEEESSTECILEEGFNQSELLAIEKELFKEEPETFIEATVFNDPKRNESGSDMKQLLANMKEEELSDVLEEDMASLTSRGAYVMSIESLSNEEEIKPSEKNFDFLQINGTLGLWKDSKPVLESPISHEKLPDKYSLMTPWDNETSLNTSDQLDVQQDILSQDSKKHEEMEIWLKGKYFDDVLELILKEPKCDMLTALCCAPSDVMKELNVKSTLFHIKSLDVELQWNPFDKKVPSLQLEPPDEILMMAIQETDIMKDLVQKYPANVYRPDVEDKVITCSTVQQHTLYHPMEIIDGINGREKTAIKEVTQPEVTEHAMKNSEQKALQNLKQIKHSPISICTPARFDDIQIFMNMRAVNKRENAKVLRANLVERLNQSERSTKKDSENKHSSSLSVVKDLNNQKQNQEQVNVVQEFSPPKSPVANTNDLDITIAPSTPSHSKRSTVLQKCNVVSAALDPVHQDLLLKLGQLSEKYIHHLAMRLQLPSTQDFFSLTPGVTRFILKQHEKKRQDMVNCLPAGSDRDYTAVIMLHTLVCCADIVAHCCIQSAGMQLEIMRGKYAAHGIFKEIVEVFQDVCENHESLSHPAMIKLRGYLSHWLVKKKLKSPGHDPKILIMMKQGVGGLCESIAEVASSVVTTEVFRPGSGLPSPQEVCAQLDNHTCLVIPAPLIDPTFPWSQFSMVVHYDYQDGQDKWKDICIRQNIRFLGVRIQVPKPHSHADNVGKPSTVASGDSAARSPRVTRPPRDIGDMQNKGLRVSDVRSPRTINVRETMSPRVPSGLTGNVRSKKMVPYTLIASDHIVQQPALLQELESNHQIFVNIRASPDPYSPDICINQDTCIMLLCLSGSPANQIVNTAVVRLSRLLLGFSIVWVVLHGSLTSPPQSSNYAFSGEAVAIVVKIQSVVANLTKMFGDSKSKVLLTGTASATAAIIRQIADSSNPYISNMAEPNQHEVFLNRLPCLNAINIHHILEAVPLPKLVRMSVEQLQHSFPHIPKAQLEVLWNVMNINQGVGLYQDAPVNRMPETVKTNSRENNDRNERMPDISVQYSPPVEFSPGKRCELPDLKLSQPNEYAKAEMEGRLLNSFMEDSYVESDLKYPTSASFQPNSRWTRQKSCLSHLAASPQVKKYVPISPVVVERHRENQYSLQPYARTSSHATYQEHRQPKRSFTHQSWSSGNERTPRSMRSMMSPEDSDRAPCIALVTPTVRTQQQQLGPLEPSPPMDLSSDDSEPDQRKQSIARKLAEMSARSRSNRNDYQSVHRTQHGAEGGFSGYHTKDAHSEPRDDQVAWGAPSHPTARSTHVPDGRYDKHYMSKINFDQRGVNTPRRYDEQYKHIRDNNTPSKKRKLTYVPVPGMKSGQTKLAFY